MDKGKDQPGRRRGDVGHLFCIYGLYLRKIISDAGGGLDELYGNCLAGGVRWN